MNTTTRVLLVVACCFALAAAFCAGVVFSPDLIVKTTATAHTSTIFLTTNQVACCEYKNVTNTTDIELQTQVASLVYNPQTNQTQVGLYQLLGCSPASFYVNGTAPLFTLRNGSPVVIRYQQTTVQQNSYVLQNSKLVYAGTSYFVACSAKVLSWSALQ